ncbi:MAG TPA: FAD:protein FMN transferase [Kiritimatiellia bacterium]|jgi:thiamine biosynthesis lipoprotein|nr:FAD:protein FMN transferase [Kiritimatiellia bacterium]OQC25273.1 MAG: Thiamine biosynthesis lipoprotein ApbE precursor [Verrucomicrobia bacterium ADurb.Bin070]HPB10517.1 FAD:protein FMN transferase [Kiritimatiellia bacterium]HQA38495.1 FAD:protein FMN transferase [Kiritimatiellia bacterium]HQQ90989.1 FAD:protein FMN transferase [Kiritimatiellia bacterium]
MRCHRRFVRTAATAVLLLLAACRPAPPAPVRLEWLTMGTVAAVQCADAAAAPHVRDLAQRTFQSLDNDLSAWNPASTLCAVNAAAGTPRPVAVPPDFAAVLQAALGFCADSEGAFNPLIGPVMQAWGFNGGALHPVCPAAEDLVALLARTHWHDIHLTTGAQATVRLALPGMQLDFGAIAKGYAVDLAWERLKAAGHTNLLIDLGGNLRALGEAAPGRGGWRTGVRNPFQAHALAGKFLMRDGEAVATSGNYERFVEIDGLRYAHIMDGRTGQPVTGMAGVTVIAPDAATADALSTALFILGPQRGAALLRTRPGCEALWIPDTPERLTVLATPGFAARLTPVGDTPYRLTVVTP